MTTAWIGPALLLAASGCQEKIAGVTPPSPYHLSGGPDFYAPPSSEFKLTREAAAIQEQNEAIERQQQGAAY